MRFQRRRLLSTVLADDQTDSMRPRINTRDAATRGCPQKRGADTSLSELGTDKEMLYEHQVPIAFRVASVPEADGHEAGHLW